MVVILVKPVSLLKALPPLTVLVQLQGLNACSAEEQITFSCSLEELQGWGCGGEVSGGEGETVNGPLLPSFPLGHSLCVAKVPPHQPVAGYPPFILLTASAWLSGNRHSSYLPKEAFQKTTY